MESNLNIKSVPLKKIFLILLLIINVLVVGLMIAAGITYLSEEHQASLDKQKQHALYANILDGISTKPDELTVDYSHSISTGSPLIFGGNQGAAALPPDAWNKFSQIGVTSMRYDVSPDMILPANITLEDYKNNVGDIQNPKNWNRQSINSIKDMLQSAKRRGVATIGSLDYVPKWLSLTDTPFGVPKDWGVYQDIVAKTYSLFRNDLDYIEIWNEPSLNDFLHLDNSNMTREEAYKQIFQVASNAIRNVDSQANDGKRAKLGGPVTYIPNDTSLLETILQDPQLKKQLDFVSYHSYDTQNIANPTNQYILAILKKYNADNLPLFVTEWNYDYLWTLPNPNNGSNAAISYTGNKFLSFLKMGLAGANYFTMAATNSTKPNNGVGYFGFFQKGGDNVDLLPQSKTWKLLSQQMGLGKGTSKIYDVKSDTSNSLNTIGFENVYGSKGIAIVNASSSTQVTHLILKNTQFKYFANVQVYIASATNDATNPFYQGIVKENNGQLNLDVYNPGQSVAGVIFTQHKDWYNFAF